MTTRTQFLSAAFLIAGFGLSSPSQAGGGQVDGNVNLKSRVSKGVGAIAGRDATVGSVVVKGGRIKGDVVIDNDIQKGVGAIAGRDATVGSVVVSK